MTAHPMFSADDLAALHRASDSVTSGKIRAIAGQAAATAGMTLARILSTDRTVAASRVRDVICYVAQQQGFSSVQIGRALNRDHSSVLSAIRREKARRNALEEPAAFAWTDERLLELMHLRDRGWTFQQVAGRFGITRNAVAGAVRRLSQDEKGEAV